MRIMVADEIAAAVVEIIFLFCVNTKPYNNCEQQQQRGKCVRKKSQKVTTTRKKIKFGVM